MTKFVAVSKAPEVLSKDVCVIKFPDFLEEIKENAKREPRGGITGSAHLRYIVGTIAGKYDPEDQLGAFNIKPHLYEGRKYNSDEELSKIVVEMLKDQYPNIFEKYLDYQVRNRPANIKLIYYVGPFISTTSFFKNGVDHVDEKDVDTYLGNKPKKVVGKPAITDAEANA